MAQETNQTQVPLLCANGCGFYGNPRNNGMCSVCYKDSLQRQNNSGRSSDTVSSSLSSIGDSVSVQLTSQHERNSILSKQSFSTPTAATHTDDATTVSQVALKTQEVQQDGVSSSKLARNIQEKATTEKLLTAGSSVEDSTSRGKRKLDEIYQPVERESAGSTSDVSEQNSDVPEQSKPKKNRCFTCRKKLGLTGFGCRCGQIFCSVHRYSDIHSCSFDYKADAAEKIRKENPLVVGVKIQKI